MEAPDSQLVRLSNTLSDRYRIERLLGEGGMATVYLAHDLRHDRKVAIKVLRPELAAVIGAERFLSEIKTTANLQHPHILPLYDSGDAGSLLYYVMPFVAGESLRGRLEREKQLPITDALRIATEIASGLDYAHRLGIIHRDIKPENILLHDGRAMVADFGIALAARSASSRITETGMSLGTPHYMSPEQAMGDREITARSDVYALGAMTYEMLLGEPPFTGPSAQSIIAKVMTEDPARMVSRRKNVPASVEAAVFTALEKIPADRFESTAKFAEALANPSYTRAGSQSGGRAPVQGRTWMRAAAGMGVVTVASLVVAASTTWKSQTATTEKPVVRFALSSNSDMRFVTQISAPFGISPDGREIVFSAADSSGSIALWVRTLDDPTPRKIDGSSNGTHPAISPNGEWVAFIEGDRTLSKVRLSGGSRMELAVLPGVSASVSWESNDAILCEVIAPSGEIMRVSANGGSPSVAVPFDSAAHEVRQRRPLVIRDAGVVLYTGTSSTDSSSIVMYSLRDRRRARLNFSGAPLAVVNGLLVYSASGSLWGVPVDVAGMRPTGEPVQLSQRAAAYPTGTAVAVSESGTIAYEVPSGSRESRLELIDFAGNRTELRGQNRFGPLRYSPDGRRVAVAIAAGTTQGAGSSSDIWIVDLSSKEATQVTNTGDATQPEWSADGKRLIYVASVKGETEVWSTPIDGSSPPTRLVDAGGSVISPSATPDGRAILVSRFARGNANITLLRIPLDAHSKIDTLVSPAGPNGVRATQPRVSPDGRFVAYADRTGRSIHVKELDGTADIQISTDGGCCPLWGPDSHRVYFRNGRQLIAADLQTAPVLSLKKRTASTGFWATDPIATAFDNVFYDLSPDGRKFVAVTPVGNDTRVFVAYNWGEELGREWKAGVRR